MATYLIRANSKAFQPSEKKVWLQEDSLFLEESVGTTRSNTPDSSLHDKLSWENYSDRDSNSGTLSPEHKGSPISSFTYLPNETNEPAFEIDVCPRRKKFNTVEERKQFVEDYKKKYKTELCKNWELRGTCKFGDKCCFAHGKHELKEKTLTHTKYKTKPCKQYFQTGYCPYGQRCQYLHKEALQPNILFNPCEVKQLEPSKVYDVLHEINRLSGGDCSIETILEKLPQRPRLSIFEQASEEL